MSLWLRRRDLRTLLYIAIVIKFLATFQYIFIIFLLIFLLDFIVVTINLIQLLAAILIRINYLSIYLFRCVHMRSQVTEIAIFVTQVSVTGTKIFTYEPSSPGNRDDTFQIKQLRFRSIAAYFLSCMYFHFQSMRISFICKVTKVHKATTAANDASLYSTILFCFLF